MRKAIIVLVVLAVLAVSVMAVSAGQEKMTICHREPQKDPVTITISVSAWPAHKDHGDTIGPCEGDDDGLNKLYMPLVIPCKHDAMCHIIGDE